MLSSLAQRLCGRKPRQHSAAAAAAAGSASARRRKPGERTLSTLAAVELHLILQCLSPAEVCMASAACHRLQLEAANPLVWQRFADGSEDPLHCIAYSPDAPVPLLTRMHAFLSRHLLRRRAEQPLWQASSLCRRYLPCRYRLRAAVRVDQILADIARYGHVKSIEYPRVCWELMSASKPRYTWSRSQAEALVALPAVSRMQEMHVLGVWLQSDLLEAMRQQMPRLTSLRLANVLFCENGIEQDYSHPTVLPASWSQQLSHLHLRFTYLPTNHIRALLNPLTQLRWISLHMVSESVILSALLLEGPRALPHLDHLSTVDFEASSQHVRDFARMFGANARVCRLSGSGSRTSPDASTISHSTRCSYQTELAECCKAREEWCPQRYNDIEA